MDFATWLEKVSQQTNRSLAGARIWIEDGAAAPSAAALGAWGLVPAASAEEADLCYPALPEMYGESAAEALDDAARHMPVSAYLAEELRREGSLQGLRIGLSLIVEPKTAVLARRLRQAGAKVGIYCHAHECHEATAQELKREGFLVEADPSWTPAEEKEGSLRLLDALLPQIVVDDGANISRLMVMERPGLLPGFIGVSEETTSGVRAFAAMECAGELPFPVMAVNDSALKTSFDNRHGTGETCVTTMQKLLGPRCFEGKKVALFGFGPVGQGFAERARSLGALVTIVERDPRAGLQALYAGFAVAPAAEALPASDIVVSATGVRHTLTEALLELCPEHSIISVIGGISLEVALDEVRAHGGSWGKGDVAPLVLPSGKRLCLLAEGNGINYTAGPGNPQEIMDLSFAVQLAAVARLAREGKELPHRVMRLSGSDDRHLAHLALASKGIFLDEEEGPLVADWRQTRYEDRGGEAL